MSNCFLLYLFICFVTLKCSSCYEPPSFNEPAVFWLTECMYRGIKRLRSTGKIYKNKRAFVMWPGAGRPVHISGVYLCVYLCAATSEKKTDSYDFLNEPNENILVGFREHIQYFLCTCEACFLGWCLFLSLVMQVSKSMPNANSFSLF